MSYGIIEYNEEGKPKCEICGNHFHRVLAHARQKHDINEREYKVKFGFELGKGICSQKSSEKTRKKTLENYDKVIAKNLVQKGAETRFKDGDKGRTKDKVSQETRIKLRKRLLSEPMQSILKESGRKLGNSGLGNKVLQEKRKKY